MAKKRTRSAKQTSGGIGSLLLIVLLFAGCTSMCGGNNTSSYNSSAIIAAAKVQSSVSEETLASSNPLLNLNVEEVDYEDFNSGVTLKRAYVKIPHDQWDMCSDEEIAAFFENRISESDATYFTIDFEDETGLYFPGCSRYDALEGTLDKDGRVDDAETQITVETDGTLTKKDPAPVETEESDEASVVEATEPDNSQVIVYYTNTGSKYHFAGCHTLKSSHETTIAKAKARGLKPCGVCHPSE